MQARSKENASGIDIRQFAIAIGVLWLIYLLFDYFNIPSLLGLRISRLNMEVLGEISSLSNAVLLFILTYITVEKWNIKKQANQRMIAISTLKSIYCDCKQALQWLEDPEIVTAIAEKTDFNSIHHKGSVIDNYQNMPFDVREPLIQHFISDGILTVSETETYHKIKSDYSKVVLMKVIFYDAPNKSNPIKSDLLRCIDDTLDHM